MLIKHSNRNAPNDLSDYERTYNHAIDLIAQAAGHANKVETRRVAAFKLRPLMYRNFCEGAKILCRMHGLPEPEPGTQMEWEGYKVLEGSRAQIDSVVVEYVENAINPKLFQ